MNDSLFQALNAKFYPEKDFRTGLVRNFNIRMNNFYLNTSGKVYKKQLLEASYTRTIREMIDDAIFFVDYKWDSVFFTNILPKQPKKRIQWEFVKDRSFQSHVIIDQKKLDLLCEENKNEVSENDYLNCFTSLETCFQGLPKLPSVYLVVMQTFDILAFENYLSYIYTEAQDKEGWEIDKWVRIHPHELEHCNEAKIGLGLYSDNSFFKNGMYFLRFSGYSVVKKRVTALFDYYCDYSKAMMSQKKNESVRRTGTSYYHGQLWIDVKTGECIRGTMEENYFALQEGEKEKPVNIKRKILCEQVE